MSLLLPTVLYATVMAITVSLLHGFSAVPAGILTIFLLTLWLIPICSLLAIIGLFLKDLAQFFPFLITITLYLTPVMYMPQSLPDTLHWILIINPVADIMALLHAAIQDLTWDWINLIRPIVLWLLLLGPAWVLFHRAEPHIRESL
jgi:lipopolysaccharide transport system permease protein